VELPAVLGLLVLAGSALIAAGWWSVRSSGALPSVARRLAGPTEVKVGRLLEDGDLPARAVRVAGRVRCADPLEVEDGERLVAFHRDVDVLVGGRWRTIERLRETRSFELWDHDGSLSVDPARAAEPLITIPKVWRGDADALQEPHRSIVARLADRHGAPTLARSIVRTLTLTDRLLVVARPVRAADGTVRLEPPAGGYLIANLALEDAMRLLAGRRRRLAALAVIGIALGVALVAIGCIGAVAALVLGS
jgi:hypothetical protein